MEISVSEEKKTDMTVKETEKISKMPAPVATGDENIAIVKHNIYRERKQGNETENAGILLAIKNISDKVIGSILFEAELYNTDGNALGTVEYKELALQKNAGRILSINFPDSDTDKVGSYNVKVAKW
jgi:hypothetical protein